MDEVKLAAFRKIMGDPTMPPDEHQDRDYDEWLFLKAWDEAVLAERERCAAACDNVRRYYTRHYTKGAEECAAAIRQRK